MKFSRLNLSFAGTLAALLVLQIPVLVGDPCAVRVAAANEASSLTGDGTWLTLSPPLKRFGHTVFYDAPRNRLVLFGGAATGSGPNSCFQDVWVLPLQAPYVWQNLNPSGTPPPTRYAHTMVYDSARDRLLIMGGYDKNAFKNDVWALSLGSSPAWTALTPGGTPPSARWGHVSVYDPVGDRMLVFGGERSGGVKMNDLWEVSLGGTPQWTLLAPAGAPPAVRRAAAAVYDPVRARMIVVGGLGASYLNDAWALSLGGGPVWAPIAPSGVPPSPRALHSASYDPGRDQVLVFGGTDGSSLNDAYVLDLASPSWSPLSPSGSPPSARFLHGAAFATGQDRLVVFAGSVASGPENDVWELDRSGTPEWVRLPASGEGGVPAGVCYGFFEPARHSLLVLFENTQVWRLSLADGGGWSQVNATPPPAGVRTGAAIYDPVRDRLVLWADYVSNGGVWELTLAEPPAWHPLTTTGTPPMTRAGQKAVYDPARDRMVVFGGWNQTYYMNDVWQLEFVGTPAWGELHPTGTPPNPGSNTSVIYDTVRDRMVVFDGSSSGGTFMLQAGDPPVWTKSTASNPPPPRYYQTAAYDGVRDRMLVFSGVPHPSLQGVYNDLWALPLEGGDWVELSPSGTVPVGRISAGAIYDPTRGRFVVHGGFNRPDTWALHTGDVVGVPLPGGSFPRLAPAWPNPSHGDATIAFALPTAGAVALRVFDVNGRSVRTLLEAQLPAGEHSVRWDGRTSSGGRAPAGLYFYELRAGAARSSNRLVLLD